MKDLQQNIADIVTQSYVLSFACINDDTPYQVWLHYAGDLNTIIIYSRRDRVHSRYIQAKNNVSVGVLPEQIPGYGVRGLTGQGAIRELTDGAEIGAAIELYQAKFGQKDRIEEQAKSGKPADHAFYEIKMGSYVIFDSHNYQGEPRKEYTV